MVRYMQPPYNNEDRLLIRELIKQKANPPESWPLFRVSLQGHAKTHAKGLRRVKKLAIDEYAYTTEAENNGEQKAKSAMELLKKKKAKDEKLIESLLRRKTLSSGSEDDEISDKNDSKGESSSGSEPVCSAKKRRKIRGNGGKETKKNSVQERKTKTFKKLTEKNKVPKNREEEQNDASKNILSAEGESSSGSEPVCSAKRRRIIRINAGKESEKNSVQERKTQSFENNTEKKQVPEKQNPPNHEEKQDDANDNIFATDDARLLYRTMMKVIAAVKVQADEILDLRHTLERSLKVCGNGITTKVFAEKYNFAKIKTVDDLRAFEARLKNEKQFRNDFHAALSSIAESNAKKTINAILKKYFTQTFAMKCTAVKDSKIKGQKMILKGTQFYESIFDFVRRLHSAEKNVTEKYYYRSLATCINNAKDWDGGRKSRIPI